MKDKSYTPGPWSIYFGAKDRPCIVKYYEPKDPSESEKDTAIGDMVGIFIAEIEADDPSKKRLAFDVPQSARHNAILISRAPDLYNALLEADQALKDEGIDIEFTVLKDLESLEDQKDQVVDTDI